MRYLYILLLGLLPFLGVGQAVEEFGARFVITDATLIPSTDSFYITGFLRHPRASFNGDSVMVGDIIVDADCNIFTIDSILGTVSNTIEVRVMPADTTVNTIRKATGGILRANAPPNGTFTLPANVPIEILDCLINYNFQAVVGGSGVDTSGFNRQFYISNDSLFIVDDSTTFFVDLSVYADSSIYNLLPYQDVSIDADSNNLDIFNMQRFAIGADTLDLSNINWVYSDSDLNIIVDDFVGIETNLLQIGGSLGVLISSTNEIELDADTLNATGITTFLGFPAGNSIFNNLPLGNVSIDANGNDLTIDSADVVGIGSISGDFISLLHLSASTDEIILSSEDISTGDVAVFRNSAGQGGLWETVTSGDSASIYMDGVSGINMYAYNPIVITTDQFSGDFTSSTYTFDDVTTLYNSDADSVYAELSLDVIGIAQRVVDNSFGGGTTRSTLTTSSGTISYTNLTDSTYVDTKIDASGARLIYSNTATDLYSSIDAGISSIFMYRTDNTDITRFTMNDEYLVLDAFDAGNDTLSMYILGNGVGINDASPSSTFDIAGTFAVQGVVQRDSLTKIAALDYSTGRMYWVHKDSLTGGGGSTPSIRNDLPTETVIIDPNNFDLQIGTNAANNTGEFEFYALTADTQDAIIYAGSRDSSSVVAGEGFAMDAFIASFGAEDGIIGVNYDYFGTVYNNALFGDSSIISSYPGAELALFVSNLPTAASTSNKVVLVQDLTTDRVYQISLDSLGGATLATNGLTMSGDTVILGGTINRATSFSGNYQWDWTGTLNGQALVTITNAGTTSGGINASGTTYGVRGTSDSYGIYGVSTIGYGVYATATTGTGIIATTTTGLPVDAQATSAITNTSKTIAKITHQTSGTPAANYGADWETVLESTTTNQTASKLRTIWTDPANATRTSSFEVQLLDSATLATKFAISGQGQLTASGYANAYYNNSDSSLYVATFDNRGYMWMTPRDSVAGISSSILNNLPLGNVTIDADENNLTIDSIGILTLRSFDTSDSSKHELYLTDAQAYLGSTYSDGSYSALSAAVAAMSMTFYDDTDTSYGIFQANASQAYMAFSENTAVPEGGVWAKEDTVGIGHITGDTRIIEVSDLSNISTADIKFFEKYYWANATPSVTSGDTAIHVWVGTGAAATPMFIDKDQFGGSTPDLSRTVISDTIFLGADYARSSGLYYFRDSLVGTADDTITVDLKKRNFTFCEFDLTSAASTVVISSMTNLYSSLSISYPLKEGEISAHTFYFTNPTSISVKWPSNFYDYGTRAAMGTDVLITSTRYNCTYDGISKFYCQ